MTLSLTDRDDRWRCRQGACQILPDFNFIFSGRFSSKFAVNRLLMILPHLEYVATLPCELFGYVITSTERSPKVW